jgi:putative IMPACT (imprinted ancient) family translation regulator
VKLGTGGLSRAYAGGVKLGLASLPTEEKVERVTLVITLAYPDVDAVQRVIAEREVLVEDETYDAQVQYTCAVPVSEIGAFAASIADATRGSATVREA